MRKNYFLRRFILSLGISILTCTLYAQTDISDAAGLAAIANNLSGSYRLTADITLTGSWTPIVGFTGTLDGNGHIISGLKVNQSTTAERGLFSTANGATIKKLGIEGASIVGNERTGAIVGLMTGGLIEECYVATSYIEGRDHVGSFCGQIKGGAVIQNCYANGNVYSREWQAGGIVGVINDNNTKISKCYFSGIVRCATNSRPAGIVAWTDAATPTIEYCVNLAPYILGKDNLRVVGNTIENMVGLYSISTCKLSSDINNYNGGTVPTSDGNYGTTKRHGANIPGGDANAKTSTFYTSIGWDFTNTWKMLGDGYPVLKWQTTPVKSSLLRCASSYALKSGAGLDMSIFISDRGLNLSYISTNPNLTISGMTATAQTVPSPVDAPITVGTNSDFAVANIPVKVFPNGYISVATPADFSIAVQYPALDYQLTTDIDMTGVSFSGIGTVDFPFTGTFDGNGHIIKGLTIENSTNRNIGLFRVTSGATIKKLGFENYRIIGNEDTGGIIGLMIGGTLTESYASNGYVEGRDHVGSLVGGVTEGALVKDCYATGKVNSREHQAGGISGTVKKGKIENCYYSGIVTDAVNRACGIVGYLDYDNATDGATLNWVKNSLNLAPYILSANSYPNEVSRIIYTGTRVMTLANNYSISTSVIGKLDLSQSSTVPTTDTRYGTDKMHGANLPSNTDAKSSTFYSTTLGWDFTNTWKMLSAGYPILKWQNTSVATSIFAVKDPLTLIEGQSLDLNQYVVSSHGLGLNFNTQNGSISLANGIATVNGALSGIGSAPATASLPTNSDFTAIDKQLNIAFFPTGIIPVSTVNDLQNITFNVSGSYKLMNDIDMTGVTFNGLCTESNPFTGTFDGNGYIIKGLTYNNTGTNSIALFKATNGATIKKLGIEGANIIGRVDVAAIVGLMKGGSMDQCYVGGNSYIEGLDHVASLAGKIYGGALIQNCYSSANIKSRATQAGGLGGVILDANSKVSKSYFSGTVTIPTINTRPAGIVALVDNNGGVTVEYCVNLASSIIGGGGLRIVDWGNNQTSTTLTSNYSISTTKMNANGDIVSISDTNYGASQRHGANLPNNANSESAAFYTGTLGWDFINIWTIDGTTGYPTLKIKQNNTNIIISANEALSSYSIGTNCNVTVLKGASLTIDIPKTLNSMTIAGGGKLTLNSNIDLSTTSFSINSDATNGTGTFVDSDITGKTINATVQQYLPQGRNWYVGIPVTTDNHLAASNLTSAGAASVSYYDEPSSSWINNYTGTLLQGVGYIAVSTPSDGTATNNVSFSGTLNTGDVQVLLTRKGTAKAGFNLIANPYPSYLNAMAAINANANIEKTIWYRTKGSTYEFETVNTTSGVGTNVSQTGTVTGYVPPMQAFWVRTATDNNSIMFTNAMRYHAGNITLADGTTIVSTTVMKTPASTKVLNKILRLQVSNGINSDEAVIYTNDNASNGFDDYDSKKMTNANVTIPEIYTIASNEDLVINGVNNIQPNMEIPLGFTTGQSNTFTIKATEINNFDAGTSIILRDNLLNKEEELTATNAYTFSSDAVATSSSSRFSILFKTTSVATGINSNDINNTVQILKNTNNQITINSKSNFNSNAIATIYNALGQKLVSKRLLNSKTVFETPLSSGVYVVSVNNGGKVTTSKIQIN